jgi:hypothetical protein
MTGVSTRHARGRSEQEDMFHKATAARQARATSDHFLALLQHHFMDTGQLHHSLDALPTVPDRILWHSYLGYHFKNISAAYDSI